MPENDAREIPREILSWPGFGAAARELATQIATSAHLPEVIIAIARGGLLPAGAIAYALDVKVAGTMNVEFYTGIDQTLAEPKMLEPLLDIPAIAGKRLLVVDDVADSGQTLKLVVDLLRPHSPEVRSAVLYTKPTTIIAPDFSWRETDRWIDFPWSSLPPVPGGAPHS